MSTKTINTFLQNIKQSPIRNYLFLSLYMLFANCTLIAQDSLENGATNKWVYFSLRPGVTMDFFKTEGYQVSNTKYNPTKRFVISAAIDLDNPQMKGFLLRGEVTYRDQRFHGEGYEQIIGFTKTDFRFRTITPELSLLYKSPWRSKLQIFAGGGLGWNTRKIVRNEGVIYYGDRPWRYPHALYLTDQEWSFSLSAGLLFKSRIEISAKLFRSEMSDTSLYDVGAKSKMVAFTYRF
ncbi:hypothetical protein A3860_17750 [Niastella vici]|uniref:Outer membrane protein beta-barrel domain-containing protein n=1 Tax=Niastella vici TaxID=1703345 RepID=A0A1V9G4D0_9BACT|nr:hypothetical protein [Niastella vici]OQP65509.1 hypothetical protein A3860_17750 [Niastella vici]